MRLQLEGTVVVYRTRSVTVDLSVELSNDNIARYNISIEKKLSDFNIHRPSESGSRGNEGTEFIQ